MIILQVADLHISKQTDSSIIKSKIDKLYKTISEKISEHEELLFLICGDVIDKGDKEDECVDTKFKVVEDVLNYISEIFKSFKLRIEFVPGNHDIHQGSFDEFNDLISKYNNGEYCFNNDNTGILRNYDDFDILLINSVFHCNREYGKVDLKCLDKLDNYKPTIIVLHHTFLSENDNDSSAIRNAYRFFEKIEGKNIIAMLHGHTHGYKDIKIGNKCYVVGVGPFIKPIENVNNQFNLIELNGNWIQKISNYRYNADMDKYTAEIVFLEENRTAFSGESVKEVYEKVVVETERRKCIYNIGINVKTKYQNFEKEIMDNFKENIEIAKDWQEKNVPESLYYNHGMYMKTEDVWGIEYIIEELKAKATSSRAIIPLINFSDVAKSKDDFLPSMDVIQFGFKDESKTTVFLTVYLRALEVKNFLKINLCEIYLMIKVIKEEIRSIDSINVNIFAFRAQYKEKYGCFKKAAIDHLSESDLTIKLIDKEYQDIIVMLKEKLDLNETVIQDKGLTSLNSAISSVVKRGSCSEELLKYNKYILERLDELKKEREKTSNYDYIEALEKALSGAISEFIEVLEKEGRDVGGH
ncbi:metallophosphoesterase family protein [Oceanirhabdus sp. W0125-5]|uniref:metallophosphoesterase family protein n=1 Tax=Oceanirhabdus sp. W0125-5 TaxID=2999116 RepID=UPI0022F2A76C|nr:metallophosphoesterase [Oceanirhabdus sp. W0125-5]WBW95256.1 metallophosphoesterase [Oceanirhabdus sp. W0125-5]